MTQPLVDRNGAPLTVSDELVIGGHVVADLGDGTALVKRGDITFRVDAAECIDSDSVGGGGGVTDHGALTGLADDDHPQYHNDARGDARYDAIGAAAAAVVAHEGAVDPHPTYLTAAEGNAAYEAIGAVAAHAGAADPHTGYQKESEKGAANGYAGLDVSSLVPIINIPPIENRTSDPGAPVSGQIWLRTDL